MRVFSTCLVLFIAGVCRIAAREALHPASVDLLSEGRILIPKNNHNGWVNPEDLTPMPQCIAQQDQSAWLSTITRCTSRQCTSHFGFICTHHQWLTQLSCLSIGFSANVIKGYLPYCSRSVLAKAQLYLWIRHVTGRTWLVDVGDTNGLQTLSPASLDEGYAVFDVMHAAPKCLTGSASALSMELFQQVVASCSFTSTTQHTGNSARPWEYSESLQSIIALDSETVGYNLAGRNIRYGNYFDKSCFCGTFSVDAKKEPCSGLGEIDVTRERLWMNATCGPTSIPKNWTDALNTTEFAYIPIEDWHWPKCITDMPKQLIELTGQCATNACQLNSGGYCKVVRAVDRACFCRDIRYNSCRGLCQIFETRIDYVKWLHDLCGNLQDWHGLPENWRQLAVPTPLDMIPWRWTLKSSKHSHTASITHSGSIKETCPSTAWKLGSLALINIATFLAAFIGRRPDIHNIARSFLGPPHPRCWFFTGISIATLQILANWVNVLLVQQTLGYENVPVVQLMLLWCSMPRLSWLTTLLSGVQVFEGMKFGTTTSSLFAEIILQVLSSYYMIRTVNYGREHDFYLRGMEGAKRATSAKSVYAGALLWLIIVIVVLVQLLQATCRRLTGDKSTAVTKWERRKRTKQNMVKQLMVLFNERWTWFEEKIAHYWIEKSRGLVPTSSMTSEEGNYTVYGTLPVGGERNQVSQKVSARLYVVTVLTMLLLWIAQWLFWAGFIGLSLDEFCPPKLGVLTTVWMAFSLASTTIGSV